MCGIVGYVGKKRVVPVIIDGLRRLEYGDTIRQALRFAAMAMAYRFAAPKASCAILRK